MREPGEIAEDCLPVVMGLLTALGQVLAGDAEQLAVAEQRLDQYVTQHRQLVDDLRRSSPRLDNLRVDVTSGGVTHPVELGNEHLAVIPPRLEPFFRLCAAVQYLVQLVGMVLDEGGTGPAGWHDYVFTEGLFRGLTFPRLPSGIPVRGVQRMLPDVLADVLTTTNDVASLSKSFRLQSQIRSAADALVNTVPVQQRRPLDSDLGGFGDNDLDSVESASNELGISESQLHARLDRRELVHVVRWDGDVAVPNFQYESEGALVLVDDLLQNIDRELNGWSLAIWLRRQVNAADDTGAPALRDGTVVMGLEQRQQWEPSWSHAAVEGQELPNSTRRLPDTLYRLTRDDLGPFWFATVGAEPDEDDRRRLLFGHVDGPKDDADRSRSPRGRYDLAADTPHGDGTLYAVAGIAGVSGVCHEIIDRQLTPTLQTLARSSLWTLSPSTPVELHDATEHPGLHIEPRRQVTQDYATAVHAANHPGMITKLRTIDGADGVVLFGRAGASLPASSDLGSWSATMGPLLTNDVFWDYVAERDGDDDRVDVLFRWFPGHVRASLT